MLTARTEGDGVNTATGYFCHSQDALADPGRGVPLQFWYTYNSDMSSVLGPMGYGWTHNYNMYIDRDAAGNYRVHEENGSVVTFDANFSAPIRVMATLTETGTSGQLAFTRIHDQTRFIFNLSGGMLAGGTYKLAEIIDRNGHETTLSYTNGRLSAVSDPAGRSLAFTYTSFPLIAHAFLASVREDFGLERAVSFTYAPGAFNLVTATDVGAVQRTYGYDSNHHLQTMSEPRNGAATIVFSNTYGTIYPNTVVRQDFPMSRYVEFDYSGPITNATSRITNTLGLVMLHKYNSNMLRRTTEFPGTSLEGSHALYYQPGTTWVSRAIDPNDNVWTSRWDLKGNLLSETDPLDRTTSYQYNSTNDLTMITNAAGLTTTLDYDGNGNLLKVTRLLIEEGQPTQVVSATYGYDDTGGREGDVLTTTNPLGFSWTYTYDGYGNLDTTSNPLGDTTDADYDIHGRQERIEEPEGGVTRSRYDDYNLPISTTNALNFTTLYEYDAVGNLINTEDAKGNVLTYAYNLNNELTQVEQPDQTHVDYLHDGLGRVVSQTNALQHATTYDYQDIDRRLEVTDPLTRTTTYIYDRLGQLTQVDDALERQTVYTYDYAGQLFNINYSDAGTPDVWFTYDDLGLRETMSDGTGITTYEYDSLGRLEAMVDGYDHTIEYGYDLASNVIGIEYPTLSGPRLTTRTYYSDHALKEVIDFDNNTTLFSYDSNGNLTSIDYPGFDDVLTDLDYDSANQVISMTYSVNTAPLLRFGYTRDPNGLVETSHDKVFAFAAVTTNTHRYEYDTLNRLVSDVVTSTRSTTSMVDIVTSTYLLDAASQITQTSSIPSSGGSTPDVVTTTHLYDAAGQLMSLNEVTQTQITRDITFVYDRLGNRTIQHDLINNLTNTYQYDQANRLKQFNFVSFSYNGDGLRMSKEFGSTTKEYTWDVSGVGAGGLPMLLKENDELGPQVSYLYGPGGIALAQYLEMSSSAPDKPGLPGAQASPRLVETFYYHADQQGNIRSLTDAFGSVTDAYNYDAYGSQVLEAGSLGTHNSLGYASQFTDGSGLVYMRARYYDPATQQFLTRDPLAAATGHPYVYAGANPINAVDPTGTAPWWLAMLGVAALGVGSSIAFDVGADYTFDNSNFDFWTSVGTSASDPGTWLAAIPSPGIARKFTTFGSKFGGIEKKAASKTAYMLSAFEIDNPPIKLGSAGGPGVGKEFSWDVIMEVFRQNPKRLCVFCRMPGANAIDHVIPKTRGGNNTIENAQLACTHCNASKGNRGAYPMSPPRGYVGPWPPPWWP